MHNIADFCFVWNKLLVIANLGLTIIYSIQTLHSNIYRNNKSENSNNTTTVNIQNTVDAQKFSEKVALQYNLIVASLNI